MCWWWVIIWDWVCVIYMRMGCTTYGTIYITFTMLDHMKMKFMSYCHIYNV